MARRTSQDKLESVLAHYSVREAARRLKVDRRTVQRWKNEGRTPTRASAGKIGRVEGGVRVAGKRTAKREGFRKPSMPVDIPAHRQTIPDPRDLVKGVSVRDAERLYSNTIAYDVKRVADPAVMELLFAYAKKGPSAAVRFIYAFQPPKRKRKRDIDKDIKDVDVTLISSLSKAQRERLARGDKNVRLSTSWDSTNSRKFQTADGMLAEIKKVRGLGKLLYVILSDPTLPTPGRGRKRPSRSR